MAHQQRLGDVARVLEVRSFRESIAEEPNECRQLVDRSPHGHGAGSLRRLRAGNLLLTSRRFPCLQAKDRAPSRTSTGVARIKLGFREPVPYNFFRPFLPSPPFCPPRGGAI